jgi:hypothetical protein
VCIERLEHFCGFDQDEVIEGAGIGHNDHADRSALRFSFNSRIVVIGKVSLGQSIDVVIDLAGSITWHFGPHIMGLRKRTS